MTKMVFFIRSQSGMNSGKGGHYRSLLHVAEAMDCEFSIVVFGDLLPDAYAGKDNILLFPIKRKKNKALAHDVSKHIAGVTILHCYDNGSAQIVKYISAQLKIPMIVTKPGGNVWSKLILAWKNMICFQESDCKNLSIRFFGPKNITLIPQRVSDSLDPISQRDDPYSTIGRSASIRLLCISRFHPLHFLKITQSINLNRRLNKENRKCELLIIGYVHRQETYDEILRYIGSDDTIRIITDDEFTRNASDFIEFSDIVVASGRSVPEAMKFGKIVFCPLAGHDLPVMLDDHSYVTSFAHNFSGRAGKTGLLNSEEAFARYLNFSHADLGYMTDWNKEKFKTEHSARMGALHTLEFYKTVANAHEQIIFCYLRDFWEGTRLFLMRTLGRI